MNIFTGDFNALSLIGPAVFILCLVFLLLYYLETYCKGHKFTAAQLILLILGPVLGLASVYSNLTIVLIIAVIILVPILGTVINPIYAIINLLGIIAFDYLFGGIALNELFTSLVAGTLLMLLVNRTVKFSDLISSYISYLIFVAVICMLESGFVFTDCLTLNNYIIGLLGLPVVIACFLLNLSAKPKQEPITEASTEPKPEPKPEPVVEASSDTISEPTSEPLPEPNTETANIEEQRTDEMARLAEIASLTSELEGYQTTIASLEEQYASLLKEAQDQESYVEQRFSLKLDYLTKEDSPYILKLKTEAPKLYKHCSTIAELSVGAAEIIGCNTSLTNAIAFYHEAARLLGDNTELSLINNYQVPELVAEAVGQLKNKTNNKPVSREAGIVMLSDDIITTLNYIKKQGKDDISPERIIINTFKVRKDQNFLKLAGFSSEEIQLLKLYYNDLGGKYDTAD